MAPEDCHTEGCQEAAALTEWVNRVVVGHRLCPWAERAVNTGSLAIVSLQQADEEELAAQLISHASLCAAACPSDGLGASTLAVAPRCESLADFGAYCSLCGWLNEALDEMGLRGVVQLAQFHPDFCFADGEEGESDEDDAAYFVGRSPYPAFHFLREVEVTAALFGLPPPGGNQTEAREALDAQLDLDSDESGEAGNAVAERNAELLRERGLEACRADVQACLEAARRRVEQQGLGTKAGLGCPFT